MTMYALHAVVADLLRETARAVVLPRFRTLAEHEIVAKAPDDLVTIADREAEELIHAGLARLTPGVRIVGEEATAADPSLLDGLGEGAAWLIDPVDGTNNFAAGRQPFGMMIALCEDGDPVAGWLYDPVADRMCHAARGGGAYIGEERITARSTGRPLPVAALATYFLPPEETARITARAEGRFELVDIPRCAAEQYPRLVLGVNDVALFQRTLPWDHAAGTLFANEAGGRVARLDGSPYRAGDLRKGMLGAASPRIWDDARAALFD